MLVRHILDQKPDATIHSITSSASVTDAAQVLSARRIGALVVSDDGKTVTGILSERDIVREIGRRGPGCMADSVRDLMTANVEYCHPGDSVESVLQRMSQGRFRHMPVTHGGELAGIVTIGDIVKARIDEIRAENDAMANMIAGNT